MKGILENNHINELDPDYKEKCRQLISTFHKARKNENVKFINTRSADNLLTFCEKNRDEKSFRNLPENCQHVKIGYFIWECQGKEGKDSTAIGRKIRKMNYLMKKEGVGRGNGKEEKKTG